MSDVAKITVNRVLLLLVVLTLLAVALPFINYAPNRLVSGEGRQLWEIWPATIWMLTGAGCALFTLCFVPGKRGSVLTLMVAQTLFIVMLWGVGRAATQLAQEGSPLARTSLGSGLWLGLGLTLLACSDAIRRITVGPLWRWLLHAQIVIVPLALLFSGTFDNLSLLKEYTNRQDVFDAALVQHLMLLAGTVLLALAIGLPLGVWCYFSASRQGPVFTVLNVIQTIPSVALFGLLIAPLAGLVKQFPWLATFGVARALAADPQVLLMDEPFGALDPVTRGALQQEMTRIHRLLGRTIVLVTHDIDEALRLADHLVLMDGGNVIQQGSPLSMLTSPENDFVQAFFGRSELGVRLLSLRSVGDYVRRHEQLSGDGLVEEMTLRDALSMFVARRCDVLPVVNQQGEPCGTLHFRDLLSETSPRETPV